MATDEKALLLQVSADVSRLEKQFQKAVSVVDGGADKMERRAKLMAERISKSSEGADPGKALTRVFDASRLAVLEEGSARLRVFGNALEPLGSYGLAAAAGIAAFGFALEEARKAAEFADQIDDTAKKLHVTTDALQEYRYAVFQAGGTEEGADQALEAFSITLGKAQEGLKKSQRAFIALGFTPGQIQSFKDTDSALRAVIERINELKNNPQRDALIDQLGLTSMKPLILEGVAAMDQLRQKAREIGIVMDEGLVQKGAEANKQIEVLEKVISIQLKSAFVDLAPVLVGLLTITAQWARAIADVVESVQSIESRSNRGLLQRTQQLQARIENLTKAILEGVGDATTQAHLTQAIQELNQVQAELASRSATAAKPSVPSGARDLVVPTGGGGKAAVEEKFNPIQNTALTAYDAWRKLAEQLARDDDFIKLMDKARFGDIKAPTVVDNLQANPNFHLYNGHVFTDDQYNELHDRLEYTIRGGLEAAFHGGIPGLLRWFGEQFLETLISKMAAAAATNILSGGAGGGGGGGFASLISTGLHFLGFAGGGSPPVGQPYVVGENGPEIRIDKAPGSILNNSVLQALARSGGPQAGMASGQINVDVTVNAQNALVTEHVQTMVAAGVAVGIAQAAPHIAKMGADRAQASAQRRAALAIR